MIAYIRGTVIDKSMDVLTIDVQGIGYGVYVTSDDISNAILRSEYTLYIHEHIRENSHDLFGFSLKTGLQLFELLLGVNGVGPKMALNMLSIGSSDEVRLAIAEGNVKYLQSASGVGKRVAERVVVDLKDKVGLAASENATTFLQDPSHAQLDEAAEALVALGMSAQDALQRLSSVDASLPVEERIKQALKN